MRRAATLGAELKKVKEELAKAKVKFDDLDELKETLDRALDSREADIETLNYENGRLRVRLEALEYSLVLAQAHSQPMQRQLFHQESRNQATAPSEHTAMEKPLRYSSWRPSRTSA